MPKMTYREAWGRLDGVELTLHGIHGHLAISGLPLYERICHHPSAKGREHPSYIAQRREFRDDWSTDITDSDVTVCTIMERVGMVWQGGFVLVPETFPAVEVE